MLADDQDSDPLPPRTVVMKQRDPENVRISESDLLALKIARAPAGAPSATDPVSPCSRTTRAAP